MINRPRGLTEKVYSRKQVEDSGAFLIRGGMQLAATEIK
jgi:hypothetical protein